MFHCCSICLHIPFKMELIFCQVGVKDTKLDFTVLLATKVLNVLLKLLNRWCISDSVRYSTLKTDSMPSLFFCALQWLQEDEGVVEWEGETSSRRGDNCSSYINIFALYSFCFPLEFDTLDII